MKSPLILGVAATLVLAPLSALADPPPWAGHGNDRGEQARDHGRGHDERGDDHYRQAGDRHREDSRSPRISRGERDHFRRYVDEHPDDPALPPGLRGKAHLPPGWQKKVRVGDRLPDDLYYRSQPVPSRFYGDYQRPGDRYTDMLLGDKIVRVLNATQTIVDVFGLNR